MQNDPLKSRVSRRFGLMLTLFAALCALETSPVTFPASAQMPPQKENRFLFIINTSSAMRSFTNGVLEAVHGLLQSGMQGQMRDGDTFGLWTYDDQLHTDFPMQIWAKQKEDDILAKVTSFLDSRHYQKRAHLDKVMAALHTIVVNSHVVTLIFIFDGSETMQGTGFDKDINDLHKEFGRKLRSDHTPFVTVLAARDGKFFDYIVNVPSTVTLPRTADLIVRPLVTNTAPVVAAVTPALIPAPKPTEPRHIELVFTNPTPAKITPTPAAPNPAVQTEPENQKQVVQPAPASIQTPPSVAATTAEPVKAPATVFTPPPPVETSKSEPVPAPPPLAPVIKLPIVSKPVAQSAPAGTPSAPPVRPAPIVAQTVVAIPSPEDHLALLVIALSLLTIAVVLLLFLIRRSRGSPSLISQSMDRPR